MDKILEINGEITGLSYFPKLTPELKKYRLFNFNINRAESSFILSDKASSFSVSKWVSPKRTRSYPFSRIYNTFLGNKKITIIPLVKDEGAKGDRDFVQWDTLSLMSLLDVYVILAYYKSAEKITSDGKEKISNQKFDNSFIKRKIIELQGYQSSALHWNLAQVQNDLSGLINKVILAYSRIEKKTGVKLHSSMGLKVFQGKILEGYENFMKYSRDKSLNASKREIKTFHKLESLNSETKARITIKNYLGGLYYFTVDEAVIDLKKKCIKLIESKNSTTNKIPSLDDIKDGLLKMMLYVNLKNVKINMVSFWTIPILNLTSRKIVVEIDSMMKPKVILKYFELNNFNKKEQLILSRLFEEAKINNFIVSIGKCL